MVIIVLYVNEVTPPQLSTMVVTVLCGNKVTPPQLSTAVVSVLKTTRPPPKALIVSQADQLLPRPLHLLLFTVKSNMYKSLAGF